MNEIDSIPTDQLAVWAAYFCIVLTVILAVIVWIGARVARWHDEWTLRQFDHDFDLWSRELEEDPS